MMIPKKSLAGVFISLTVPIDYSWLILHYRLPSLTLHLRRRKAHQRRRSTRCSRSDCDAFGWQIQSDLWRSTFIKKPMDDMVSVSPFPKKSERWFHLQMSLRKSIHHAGFFSESRFDSLEICEPLKKDCFPNWQWTCYNKWKNDVLVGFDFVLDKGLLTGCLLQKHLQEFRI